ncbi:RlmE family RNA methyltransferase [Dissulfurirhabdus thermomarina]|uniref:Ribosomal RNA large subunit methyltransferase E n=1 Tax=Dissulfurirhabdus thermomarina TaxID=1765737 RepID=A0A6N9TLW3_DISTH|nr:RlmE family RNA methyltransferase [Dissulfurirhabdus thermomarina]NDY42225.1 RlmE family RNA methyltransferase [Dissulfurirhabdus thermomarina]NMX23151.1 RlmE family RNA methyltransferase [Dissulfurirhabdus thermomarina]
MRTVRDHYFRKAKEEGYPARSVYKLKEIQAKFRLLRQGDAVVDLGASPGSWTRYCLEVAGPGGAVVAVDRHELKPGARGAVFLQDDVFQLDPGRLLAVRPRYDVVLSDMAPKTTGRRDVDHYRSVALADRALEIARAVLRPGGRFCAKVFQGEDLEDFRRRCQVDFRTVRLFKPRSSRPESVEVFIVGLDFRPSAGAGIASGPGAG